MKSKLIIYYKPSKGYNNRIETFTFSISRIDIKDNIYKQKVIIEHKSSITGEIEEYKLKEIHLNAAQIIDKILSIDFNKNYPAPIFDNKHDYFLVKYDNKKIETSDKESIKYILDLFKIDKLMSITHKHYKYIKDMYEYTELVDILNTKNNELTGKQLITLAHIFKRVDPYDIFENMDYLEKYLDTIKIDDK